MGKERGSGPTLLLIPGGAQDAGVFAALASELSDRFTVIALDPRCNSRSFCDDMGSDLDVDQHADDAAAVIAASGGGPVAVFGTSGGAQVGLNLAARQPGTGKHARGPRAAVDDADGRSFRASGCR